MDLNINDMKIADSSHKSNLFKYYLTISNSFFTPSTNCCRALKLNPYLRLGYWINPVALFLIPSYKGQKNHIKLNVHNHKGIGYGSMS